MASACKVMLFLQTRTHLSALTGNKYFFPRNFSKEQKYKSEYKENSST